MPCFYEQRSVGWCVERAWQGIDYTGRSATSTERSTEPLSQTTLPRQPGAHLLCSTRCSAWMSRTRTAACGRSPEAPMSAWACNARAWSLIPRSSSPPPRPGLRATDVPITYHPRLGPSKLRRWRDGLRHVRFMFSQALFPQPCGTSSGPSPTVMSGNGVRFNARELIPSGQPETSRLSRPTVDASASGGQPPAARPEVP